MEKETKFIQIGIREEIKKLLKEIGKAQAEIYAIQAICKHPEVEKEADSNTGNWDGNDKYWYNCFCSDCDKRWREDQ